LLSYGSVQVDVLNDDKEIVTSKIFNAPTFILIKKNNLHKITALKDNTVCVCIHAIRTIDEELVDPDFLISELECGDGELRQKMIEKYNKEHKDFVEYKW
jgi:hypothetical protein